VYDSLGEYLREHEGLTDSEIEYAIYEGWISGAEVGVMNSRSETESSEFSVTLQSDEIPVEDTQPGSDPGYTPMGCYTMDVKGRETTVEAPSSASGKRGDQTDAQYTHQLLEEIRTLLQMLVGWQQIDHAPVETMENPDRAEAAPVKRPSIFDILNDALAIIDGRTDR
jgi:hypothetical protein